MAEFVQQSIEEMLPELETMQRAKLLTARETMLMLKKRKAFEYRLRRRTKQKEDFLQYAQYEMNVLQLIHKRRKRIGYSHRLKDIEIPIIQRIHKIFKMAYTRFQNDVTLFLSHIDFCKTKLQLSMVSHIYTTMLQVHNRKPALWVAAAKFEIEGQNAMENARPLLQRGLRFNTHSALLWREYFRMELLFAEKMRKRQEMLGKAALKQSGEESVSDDILEGAVAYVVFKQATTAIPDDVQFWLSFVDICRIFDFTHKLHEDIMNALQTHHTNSEHVLAAVARQHLYESQEVLNDRELGKDMMSQKCVALEEKCYKTFDRAVKEIPTELMYSLYVDTLLDKLDTKSRKHHTRRLNKTLLVFQRAADVRCLSESLALKWCELLELSGKTVALNDVIQQITDLHPSCARVWHARLSHCVAMQESYQHAHGVFMQACKCVKPMEQLCLWQLMHEWLVLQHQQHVNEFLQHGVLSSSKEVSVAAKIWSLEHSALHEDISQVRKTYKRLCTSQPLSLEFFDTYIALENSQPKPRMKLLRSAYEDATREFGSTRPDLWLAFIKFELSAGDVTHAGQLHWLAMKALDAHLMESFTTQYTLVQNGLLKL